MLPTMNPEALIPLIISAVVSIVVLYYVIYLSVLAALREHSVWHLAGGAEVALAKRKANNTP